MFDSKLYPWQPYRSFETKDQAIAYALEVEGYRALWFLIARAELTGLINAN